MSDLYSRLGVERNASTDEIRRAYKDAARVNHPDRGGNAEKFKSIQEAHEILSDDSRRRMYDLTGSTNNDAGSAMSGMAAGGIPFQFMGGMGPFGMPGVSFDMGDILGSMFGGGGGRRQSRSGGKGPNKFHDIGLRLRDFYNGHEIKLTFNQARKCKSCSGSGSESTEECRPCNGTGVRTIMRQLGPGMMAQTRSGCEACGGEGKRSLRACRGCNGKKCTEREKSLDIKIKPGMSEGEQLTFAGECSDSPEYDSPGDVVLTLRRATSEDVAFEWKGDDLWIRHTVTFSESILGFTVSLSNHPDGKSPSYTWRGGPLIHGASLCFPNGGMPKKAGVGFGNLYVQVMITPPLIVSWTPEDAAKLQSVLGGSSQTLDAAELPTLVLSSAESLLT